MKKHPKGFASNSSLFSSLLGGGQGNSGNGGSRLHRVEENDRQTVGLSDKDRVGESILEDEEMHRDELGLSIATSEISLRTMPMINSVENDFSSSDNEDVDDEFTDLHEEEENLLYYRRDDHYGEEMSEDSSTGASTTRVNTNALVTPTNPILNYGTETSTTLKKKKKKKKKKKSDKAKLDLQFMIRFFKMVGYCLRDIGYNSDYHWTDENGRRVSRTFFRNRVMNELNENSKQEKKGCGTLCYNFSMFNAFLVLSFLFVCIGEILLGNEVGKLPGAFYTVIIDASAKNFGDAKPFIHVMLTSLLWICGITALKTFRQFVLDVIRVYWRRNLTYHTQRRYFENSNFYKMLLLDKRIDNPDQRITKDAENFVDTTCKLIESVFTGPITVFYYTVTVFLNLGWQGPLFCFVFFVIGSICNKLIISPIANLWFIQEKFEGNFRYTHALLRSNAESVAFYGGERNEKMKCNQKLKGAIKNRRKIVFWNLLLNGNMNLFGYVGSILAYVIVAISVFLIGGFIDANATAGEIAGKISVSSFQVMMLIYGFTTFIQTGSNISELAGFTGRLGEMHEVMNEIEKDTELNQVGKVSEEHSLLESTTSNSQHNFQQESDLSGSTDSNVNYIEFKNVSVSVPKGIREKYRTNHNLVENLSFKILPSQHTLIAGPSGCGKSSVLRILANLWPNNSGQIIKPSAIIGNSSKPNIFYVPQNPYISSGSLRDQITYPLKTARRNIEDHPALLEAIQLSRLEYILDRVHKKDWDGDCNWNELLSPGEKQRLALARIFYHKPTFVILDEATSACDVNVEEMIYRDIIKQGSTVVSVGHRPTIVKFHTHMLRINASSSPTTLGNGKGWEFGEISDFRKKKNY